MIITCKPHGANLIGASKFRNKPKKALDVYQTLLPLFWGGGGGIWGRDYELVVLYQSGIVLIISIFMRNNTS